jgi:hypothetical protein
MSSEIIQNVAYDNYDDFHPVNFIFSQNFISLFWGLFNEKIDLRITESVVEFYVAFKRILKCPID